MNNETVMNHNIYTFLLIISLSAPSLVLGMKEDEANVEDDKDLNKSFIFSSPSPHKYTQSRFSDNEAFKHTSTERGYSDCRCSPRTFEVREEALKQAVLDEKKRRRICNGRSADSSSYDYPPSSLYYFRVGGYSTSSSSYFSENSSPVSPQDTNLEISFNTTAKEKSLSPKNLLNMFKEERKYKNLLWMFKDKNNN